ncbi:RNA polymerase, sigma-24 subunit, ECF subfamily [Thermobaculum terrenum ATCC BAA-798]|uniref:RNA polymerase, sigma-24 subunit, ECF subfamily n=1 Tax=Thermobaculum terrenum (strain ATCC BAA-798 / CCMEE 7001 / YNP1) TaxID=525904 RepID=D1CFU8_THET1|nr:sigma-70 family RNA polymerase sigma factor [Thermobaculum terrenum]ACZ41804.1 RNA polymerase, sigma-24 subunit, ECF subfamily [Thermobaculum terrenum ATCC BAA-798]
MNSELRDNTSTQHILDKERELVEKSKVDRSAFAELYASYAERLYNYIYSRVHNREDAEDLTSLTFMLALEAIEKYEWRNLPFGAWLFRIASNQIAVYYRKKKNLQSIEDLAIADSALDPERETMRIGDQLMIQKAINRLNPDQQKVIRMRYSQGMKNREIAEVMGRTEGAVKLLIHRATNNLRAQMSGALF